MPPGDSTVDTHEAGAVPQPAGPIVVSRVGAGIDFSDPNSPLAPYYMRPIHVIAFTLIVLIFSLASYFPLWHTDVWGHMKYGKWMVEHGRIPDREPFSPWWDGRQKFTQFYTITQTVMYGAYHAGEVVAGGDEMSRMAGGIEMERALHALLTAGRFAVMLFVFIRLTKSWPFALLGLSVMLLLEMRNVMVFRPQTFAELFVAILLLPLSRVQLSNRSMYLVPLLLAFWANSHGSFIVGLAIIGLLLFGRSIDLLTTAGEVRPWKDPRCRRLAILLVASTAAIALLNPYGPKYFLYTLQLTQHPSLSGGISEWKPLEFKWEMGWHWVLMMSLVAAALTQLADKKSFPAEHTMLLLAFGTGAALQERFVVWWALIFPWVIVPKWAGMWAARQERLARQQADSSPDARSESTMDRLFARVEKFFANLEQAPSFRKTLLAVLLGWALFMWSGLGGWILQGSPTPVNLAVSPGTPWKVARQIRSPNDEKAVFDLKLDEILRHNYKGKFVGSVMATPMQGDYLMWALAPEIPVTYAHIHLFHPDYWTEIGIVGKGLPGWWEILDKYYVNLIVVEADHSRQLTQELKKSGDWQIIVDETDLPKRPGQNADDLEHELDDKARHMIAIRIHPLVPRTKPSEKQP